MITAVSLIFESAPISRYASYRPSGDTEQIGT